MKETVSQIYHSQYAPIDPIHQDVDDDVDDLTAHMYKQLNLDEHNDEFELYLNVLCPKVDALRWCKVSQNVLPFTFIKNLLDLNSLSYTGSQV